jgi:membrane protein involved in colicin uptake
MATFFALFPVEHNNKLHLFGDPVELEDHEAKGLLKSGVVSSEKPQFMTEAQHESHQTAKTLGELFENKASDLSAERAAGIAAEAQRKADVAQAEADREKAAAEATVNGETAAQAEAPAPATAPAADTTQKIEVSKG